MPLLLTWLFSLRKVPSYTFTLARSGEAIQDVPVAAGSVLRQ